MFIVLLTEKIVQIMYFVIKTDHTFLFSHFLKNIESVKTKNRRLEILHVRKI